MKEGFTRKKVESLTLGEKLRKLRADFRISLADVSKATKIQVKYLEFLENGQYSKLPADVYTRGFLRSYARFLAVDEQALIRLYERERNIQEHLGQESSSVPQPKNFETPSFVITSRSLIFGIIFLLVFGAFFYLYREFQTFAAEPQLVVLAPGNGSVVTTTEVVVRGKTDKGAQVTLNDQTVFVDDNGEFTNHIFVKPGTNTLRLTTTNRFQKEKTISLTIDAQYDVPQPATEGEATSPQE